MTEMDELLRARSKKLLEVFTSCAAKHMAMLWLHRTEDDDKFRAEILLDPVMVNEVYEAVGQTDGEAWCERVKEILEQATEDIMVLYAEVLGGDVTDIDEVDEE